MEEHETSKGKVAMIRTVLATLAVAGLASVPASAASALDFGAWCSQIAKLSPDRCLEGQPEDRAAYDQYVEAVARFDNELIEKQSSQQSESDRVNRMGDVTPDRDSIEDAAATR